MGSDALSNGTANNTTTTPNPLGFMTKFSATAYIYSPTPSTTPASSVSSPSDPKLLILATWMGARPAHIAKYLLPYRSLYPSTPIVLLRSEPRHFFKKNAIKDETSPALPFIKSIFPTPASTSSSPEVLIHVWSNGGSIVLSSLRLSLLKSGHLPKYAIIYDSTPGLFHYKSAFLAFTTGLKGWVWWLAAGPMHLFCVWFWLWHVVVGKGRTGPLVELANAHNNTLLKEKEVRRTYIYSQGDRLVKWVDVENHGKEAKEKGFREVRMERFEGTEHVAHARGGVNEGRYWGLVKGTWEGFGQ
ncbi:hypothetical protein QBC35DRAFT_268320 [Podospora australis]|uniref:Indole-diterpene biosynthesis protein PaxU n=1 Tax=Podospora australis TaxID=1536484 RepID=A0AAN6WR75_9PEZI|nr:hypothetical protein QBC35DRAFT_268320 [Podospora australis]